ncbi:MAG: hypothetical protein ACFCGT_06375 [Sandaracinaceae bacterium]
MPIEPTMGSGLRQDEVRSDGRLLGARGEASPNAPEPSPPTV